ncbi:undecaprenyl-diphosphate phosphatase [Methylococcus mesophilus]|uniref:undecaprenyl-diphosphate phosphatase n=1 Tax=Methylococcus mesophilus TaxID=2993564 RepID=UPI00224B1D3B|nr:undecaprenyl-diphosphate phosphatase [Methylococcus mesophilus]UZR30500.1 undecaprenyl-diphosphate phosphatase [Methylococcus mesophilus]
MLLPDWLNALILGLVEGLTEFLPVSSTGHLILVGELLKFNDDRGKLFEVVIQSGAILAVCWEYRRKLIELLFGLGHSRQARRFVMNLIIAFIPAGVVGFLAGKAIKAHLFNSGVVASAFIVGGFIILWVERRRRPVRVDSIDDIDWGLALKLGLFQTLAMLFPGTSRSGATIIGGLLLGLSRRAATEFSFFMAIPTLFIATAYDLYKTGGILQVEDISSFGIGFAAAFVSAFLAVRGLLRYIGGHDFTAFAWYRIAFGLVVLATAHYGLVAWSA